MKSRRRPARGKVSSNKDISKKAAPGDLVDSMVEAWTRQHPALDGLARGLVYRVLYINERFVAAQAKRLRRFHLTLGSYGVLAALRRIGPPFALTPSALVRALALSSGGISNLLVGMERRGLITRTRAAHDGRGVVVKLTAKGKTIVDAAAAEEAKAEVALARALPPKQRKALSDLLRTVLLFIDAAPRRGKLHA
ncbi:MAG: MarR family transcriptional regulator [Rhodospirillaceae bacterium]|nr:MarR family transcriptional regulator [Rhodospirillaceae bacterium]